jgi:glucosamine--fructose-6-phosphate aminotransferase (isomerizing)
MAVPASEILLRPRAVFPRGPAQRQTVVVVSRSGTTSEAVLVTERCSQEGHPTVSVGCRPGSPASGAARYALVVPAGDERAIVMTRSFTAMLTVLLRVIATVAGERRFARDLEALPSRWAETEPSIAKAWSLSVAEPWLRAVALGGGAAFGIAREAALKLTEMSRLPVEAFEPLEFRHGPISIVEPGVLLVALPAGPGEQEESRIVDECRALGAATWAIGAEPTLGAELHPVARFPLFLPPLQALAVGVTVARGLDPDAPRHLGQVVLLERDR